MAQATTNPITAPPRAKKAKFLKDADGNLYLWTKELAERGDLVAAFDPDEPTRFDADYQQIALNRELEIARDNADAQTAARLEAEKAQLEAEEAKREAEELALANERNLLAAQKQLEEERQKNALALAEMQAKLDALAKGKDVGQEESAQEAVTKVKKPRATRKVQAVVQERSAPKGLDVDTTDSTEPEQSENQAAETHKEVEAFGE